MSISFIKHLFFYIKIYFTTNIIIPPTIAIINPIIFSPELPSFWSPNPKNFFVIFLASYIKITPVRTN